MGVVLKSNRMIQKGGHARKELEPCEGAALDSAQILSDSFISDRAFIDEMLRHVGYEHADAPPACYHPPPQLCRSPLGWAGSSAHMISVPRSVDTRQLTRN
jgi:hypothetical protein